MSNDHAPAGTLVGQLLWIGDSMVAWRGDIGGRYCPPACVTPAPEGWPNLALSKDGLEAVLSWTFAGASDYDVVRGTLATLRSSDGDFAVATDVCLWNDLAETTLSDSDTPVVGDAYWYVLRRGNLPKSRMVHRRPGMRVGVRWVRRVVVPQLWMRQRILRARRTRELHELRRL